MTIRRVTSLIMAVLMVFSVFTMTATAAVEPAGIYHIHVGSLIHQETTYTFNSFTHTPTVTKYYVCILCEAVYSDPPEEGKPESHSYEGHDLIDQYHSGKFHYYVYSTKCKCGSTSTETLQEICGGNGNPCGNIHLSVPDENI